MIIKSKKKSLNCILLRKGRDRLFIYNYYPKKNFPLIKTEHQNKFNTKPFISETKNFSLENKTNTNNRNNTIRINIKNKTSLNESFNNESSLHINNNTNSNNYNKKTKDIGISVNIEEFLLNNKTLNKKSHNSGIQSINPIISFNNKAHIMYSNFNKNYQNNFYFNNGIKTFKNDDTNSKKSIESSLKGQKKVKKKEETKEKQKLLKNRRKFDFMKNILNNNTNFLIDDYLKSKFLIKKNKSCKYIIYNSEEKNKVLNNQNGYYIKEGHPILIKDIKIKSLLNDYENKKTKSMKLLPFIIKDIYLRNKYGKNLNTISGIKDYELKINLKKNFKYHIKLGSTGNIF